jgi:5-methylcytosine-specific restriction endonuclease McrA
LSRRNIIKRDGNKCAYCGKKETNLTIDHILPKARGGKDTWENLVASCVRCNNKKGDRTPEEAGLELNVRPYKPNYIMFLKNSVGTVESSWKQFLFQI